MTQRTATTDVVPASTYLLDNAAPQTADLFASLEDCYDHTTQNHLQARGLEAGWHCLEVGAGSGSIARWLAERAGPGGRVLATDIDPRWLQTGALPQLEVLAHDVASDPLPESAFDLIHERLVLVHVPSRDAVLDRLATALKPGGWLVLEEFDDALPICLDPVNDDERTFIRVGQALSEALRSRGGNPTWSRTLSHRLASAGLVNVGATAQMTIYHGGSPEARPHIAGIEQLGDGLIDTGLITTAERDTFRRLLDDPSFVGNHLLMITTWGKRPAYADD